MVFKKIREAFSGNDDKYEALYYKYSQVKLENSKNKSAHIKDKLSHKDEVHRDMAKTLINLYEDIEIAKQDSYKIQKIDVDLQRLLMDVNKIEKTVKEAMKRYSVEEMDTNERFYDPEIHEVASYQDSKGMAKGLLLKTVKKGFKYKDEIIKKPRVVVTK